MLYLGVDWGEKRIGLSLGDDEVAIATPFKVVANLEELIKAAKEERIDILVLGVPYSVAGKDHKLSEKFSAFFKELKSNLDIPIREVDERMSSKAGDARVGNKKTKAPRDAIAAMEILQSYLDLYIL